MNAFAPFLVAGTYETTYLVRATSPGSFVAGPPGVYEMQNQETRGRGEAHRVVVEAGPAGG